MDIRPLDLEPSEQISRPSKDPVPAPNRPHPPRVWARAFGVFGVATAASALALFAIVVQSSIIEF